MGITYWKKVFCQPRQVLPILPQNLGDAVPEEIAQPAGDEGFVAVDFVNHIANENVDIEVMEPIHDFQDVELGEELNEEINDDGLLGEEVEVLHDPVVFRALHV